MNYQRVVVLKEKEGERYLSCWIGTAEADAIAVKIQGVSVPRPLTHDFICQIIDFVGGKVHSAIIDKLINDTFHAKLVVIVKDRQARIDCRPSDALAVAVRKDVPIFVDDKVLNKAGILLNEETGKLLDPSLEETLNGQKSGKSRFETFSEPVQSILERAEAEAKRMNCSYVCTGHLLLSLANEMNTATEVLKNAGVSWDKIQMDIETIMKEEKDNEGGGSGLTSAVKETIQISIAEAKRLGSEKVFPEHVLLGLARTTDSIAARQLKNAGITPEIVYIELIQLYTGNR
jgi:bifunctional DNase/RNase